jgi:PAS domain S-box-containing protein
MSVPPQKPRPSVLPRSAIPGTGGAPGGTAVIDELRAELQAWAELAPLGQLVFDDLGHVVKHNATLARLLGPLPTHLREATPDLQALAGWPDGLPAVGASASRDGWLPDAQGEPVRVRVRVRGLPVHVGSRGTGTGAGAGAPAGRWLALFEDRRIEDERDIARVEIDALMGTAGLGVATWDAARGWVSAVSRHGRPEVGDDEPSAATPGPSAAPAPAGDASSSPEPPAPRAARGSLMAVGRDVVEPESMAEYDRLQAALRSRTRIEVRYAVRHRDSGRRWLMTRVEPARLGGQRAAFSVVTVDVTEEENARRRNEDLLAEMSVQADRTRAILDSVLVGIVTVGSGGIEWMNRSARRMFGGELADFIDVPISTVATDEMDHPLRRTHYAETLEEGQAETFECRLRARDGRTFWVVGNVVVTGQDTAHQQLTYALLDIERRRAAEVSILQARASLQRIIETAPLAIALFDADTQQVLQINQTAATFAGRPSSEIVGRVPAQMLPGSDGARLAADLHRAQAIPEGLQREVRRVEADGTERVWDLRIVALRATADASDQILLVASDVTAQRAADEARLNAVIAQREMLVKEVHHRIKNNLQGVAGLLQQSASRHPEAAQAIAEAVSQVHAIAQVHGLQVGVTGPMRVRGVVEAIASSVQRMFGRTIRVVVEGPAPHRFALSEADSIPIALTVNELFTNAIKHSAPAAGQPATDIRCTVRFAEQSVDIAIANVGTLVEGFSLARIPAGVSGLGLVRSLLPRKGARLSLEGATGGSGPEVVARLVLEPPAVTLLEPL